MTHIGLAEGIVKEQWFIQWVLPSGDAAFNLWVFLLSLLNVILSWLGYHQSIKDNPLKGNARFLLDIMLVLAYALMLVKYGNLSATIQLLAFVYVGFIAWDACKLREYRKKFSRRQAVTVTWAVYFLACAFLRNYTSWKYPVLILAYFGTVMYRVDKQYGMGNRICLLIRDMYRAITRWGFDDNS